MALQYKIFDNIVSLPDDFDFGSGVGKKQNKKSVEKGFKNLQKWLKNPKEFPDTIKEIQMKLGIEIGTGFRNGGLAGILEV